jgi:hypothetical protein
VLYIGNPTKADTTLTDVADAASALQFNLNGVQSGEGMQITPHFRQVTGYYHSPESADGGVAQPLTIPFALNLCSSQPSGSLNFSRLDSSRLEIAGAGTAAFVSTAKPYYAVNWNVLKIENGMGGLMYSN